MALSTPTLKSASRGDVDPAEFKEAGSDAEEVTGETTGGGTGEVTEGLTGDTCEVSARFMVPKEGLAARWGSGMSRGLLAECRPELRG